MMVNAPTSSIEDSARDPVMEAAIRRRGSFPRTPVIVRLLRRCIEDPATGCWLWQGARRPNGYGVIGIVQNDKHTVKSAHRVAYEHLVGPIPAGMHLDHRCGTRWCVNPAHLEPVTQAENNRRIGDGVAMLTGQRPEEATDV